MPALLLTHKKGGKTKATKTKFPAKFGLRKSYWSMMIMHIIFDLMGNDLQNQFMTYLWFGIKMKHLHVWSFIHLVRFSSIRLDRVFLLMLLKKQNANVLISLLVMRNSICILSFHICRIIFLNKKCVFDLICFGVCFFTKRVRILV